MSDLNRLLCIDPGGIPKKNALNSTGATGWAFFEYDEDTLPVLAASGQIVGGPSSVIPLMHTGPSAWPLSTRSLFTQALNASTQIVIENWKPIVANADPSPLRIIGACELWGYMRGVQVDVPMPGRRSVVSDDQLALVGLLPPDGQHAVQAARHGAAWLLRHGHKPLAYAIDPPS